MKKSIISLVLIFTAFTIQAQRNVDRTNFRAGVNGGLVLGDFAEAYSFSLGVDFYHHWGVSKALDIGVTAGFQNAFGSKENITAAGVTIETEFDNIQFLPVGASLRIYPGKNVGFKFGGDIGYALGINEGNEGALYYRPSLGIDLRDGTSELNISYYVVNDEVAFSSVLLSYLFLF
ncbi:MAG: hypothetical protein AB8B59_06835 [Maribacter sp.]